MEHFLYRIKKYIPQKLSAKVQPFYHYTLTLLSVLIHWFPSRKLFVIGVTGTKGKTTVIELINSILEEAGYKTALSSTLRFKIDSESYDNQLKMTMPGRFFIQRFLRKAIKKKCHYAILEMTSEGVKQFRHKFILLNALIFTNLAPEHIESHGSYEKYRDAKLQIAQLLEKSSKKRRIIIANKDDKEGDKFLNIAVPEKYPYTIGDAEPYELKKEGLRFTFDGVEISSYLSGQFNIYNILAAAVFAKSQNIGTETIKKAIEKFKGIPGRMEKIDGEQSFTVIVDYAHTPDSLEKVYQVFQGSQKICVLGATGGGRDRWKRKEIGGIAARYCSKIILTNEDPYDEDPKKIVKDIETGITEPIYTTIMDRREAIREALQSAKTGDVILITGKGTDPYIMGPSGSKLPWSDAKVTREELAKLLEK